MESEFVIVTTTIDSAAEGSNLVCKAVEKKFAACGHITEPIVSSYFWEGQLTTSQEWECVFKTTRSTLHDLKSYIKNHHTYDLPQILVTAIIDGEQEYLQWIRESVNH